MDFNVIRPKLPSKRPGDAPPPTKAATPPPQPMGGAPSPPAGRPQGPPPQPSPRTFMGPYTEEFYRVSHVNGVPSIEYTNAQTWRMNIGDYPNNNYDNNNYYENSQQYPFRGGHGGNNYHHPMLSGPPHRMCLPPPAYQSVAPPPLALPMPNYHHGPPAPAPAPALIGPPPMDYQQGPFQDPYSYRQPYHGGGYFSDENPNGCKIM